MRLLKTLILTTLPPLAGLSTYYLNIHAFPLPDLADLILRQLWYADFYWLCFSFGLNYGLVVLLDRRAPKV